MDRGDPGGALDDVRGGCLAADDAPRLAGPWPAAVPPLGSGRRSTVNMAARPQIPDPAATLAQLVAILSEAGASETAHGTRDGAIDALDGWLERGYEPPEPPSAEAGLIAAGRWLLNERPDHPIVPVWAGRATKVLRELDDKPLAALLGGFAFEYLVRIGDFAEAGNLVAEMWDRTADSDEARLTWLPSAALYLWLTGRPQAALAALKPALADPGIAPRTRCTLLDQAAGAALSAGEPELCVGYLDEAERLVGWISPQDAAHLQFLRAGAADTRGDLAGAQAAMAACEQRARPVGARFFKALWRLGAALLRLREGHARRAERELTDLLGDVVVMRARYLEWSVRLARASARLALDRAPAAEADLAAALRIAAQNGYVNCDPWGITPGVRVLLELATERGIEGRTARAMLRPRAVRG